LELLDRLPDDGLRYELLDGTLLVSPAPSLLHHIVAANIFRRLDAVIADGHAVLFAPLDWQPDGYAEGGIPVLDRRPMVPAVHVYDLVDGGYRLTTTARDDETAAVSEPFKISMVPSGLQRT
jgi:hypothetical protein